MAPTIAETLADAVTRLAPGTPSPRPDAEELLSRLLGLTRGELEKRRAQALTPAEHERFDSWVTRRARGEPVQYITGRAAFRHLDLAVDRAVLVPRPETEGLVEAVLKLLTDMRRSWPAPRVLDLGTGSGAIALAIASELPAARVVATDASEAALAVARANAESLGLGDRVRFAHGDWFDAIGADDRFEVIVSNPPYIAEHEAQQLPRDVREWEPREALYSGADGLDALRTIIEDAPRHLFMHGVLALELAEMRAEQVRSWFDGAHDWTGTALLDDLGGRPRVLLARREAGPAIAPAQWGEERE